MVDPIRPCRQCGNNLKGRTDKKFCDDYCRNVFNNKQNSRFDPVMKQVNNILKHNRKLLRSLLSDGSELVKCPKKKLLQQGFDFNYHTHLYSTRKGSLYRFCYDYGYLHLGSDWLLVVKRNRDTATELTSGE